MQYVKEMYLMIMMGRMVTMDETYFSKGNHQRNMGTNKARQMV